MRVAPWVTCLLLAVSPACGPTTGGSSDDAAGPRPDGSVGWDGPGPNQCVPGQPGCLGNLHFVCGPDGQTRLEEVTCPTLCDAQLGCVTCLPGTRQCVGSVSQVCDSTGSGWAFGRDCADWSVTCGPDGYCEDLCAEAERTASNVGCEYWPVALANTTELSPAVFDYRVVVANPSPQDAHVRFSRAGTQIAETTLPPGGLEAIVLPWVDGQSFAIGQGDWRSLVVADGAYRVLSDVPVIATQYNPFEYSVDGVFSYTNDASLLLPVHVLTGAYVGASWVPLSRRTCSEAPVVGCDWSSIRYPGYLAIVGISPEPTAVTLTAAGEIQADAAGRIARTSKGGSVSFALARGEVAHVTVAPPPECVAGRPGYNSLVECETVPFVGELCDYFDTCSETDHDLTGTRVSADGPVEVFGGHTCAYVPHTSQACDHLEEQMPPIQTWGADYVGAPMGDGGITGRNIVRVVAAFDGTVVTVTPAQGGVNGGTLGAGQYLQFDATTPYRVQGSRSIMVAQYLVGQYASDPPAARGDPAVTVLAPAEQYRSDYTFILPTSYNAGTNGQNHILVIRPPGLAITLDGAPLAAAFQPIGDREIGVALLDGGTHHTTASEPFGLIAYGMGSFTSYATPAGLDLESITIVE